jgi:hypothetical protein
LVPLVPRVPHLRRAALAIEYGRGAGEFIMHGVPLVAAGGLPTDRALRVLGERRSEEPYGDLWDQVALEVTPGAHIAKSELAGSVGVDWARLMFVDLEALASWDHHRSTDGLADFVFWGRDAAKAARHFEAPQTEERVYGFVGMELSEAATRGEAIEAAVKRGDFRLATDFRAHTQHHALLKQMRASKTGSGTLELAGTRTCAFFTSWGDGHFPVFRDLDGSGQLVQLRVHLGTEQALRNMASVNGR